MKKREVVTTTTTTTVYEEDNDNDDDDFERIEREVMDPTLVDEILEEARQKADNIKSEVITTTTVQPGETKEIITTTTIRTIESINLDDISEPMSQRQYSDDDEEYIQKKMVETVQKTAATPPPTPFEYDGRSSDVQQLPDQLKFDNFGDKLASDEQDSESAKAESAKEKIQSKATEKED